MIANSTSCLRIGLAAGVVLVACSVHAADGRQVEVTFDQPAIDRWNYPFNPTPGTRGSASTFSAIPDPAFDERDGQALLIFDTAAAVQDGFGPAAYTVTAMTLTFMVESDATFRYDPTADPWQSWLEESDPQFVSDPDAGRPVELFGVSFRDGLTLETYANTTPYCDGCDCFTDCVEVRSAYPIDFDSSGAARDVSNNVRDQFDPNAFALGAITTVAPGELVPTRTDMTFTIDVDDPDVQCYLADALDRGRLALMVTSQHLTVQFGDDGFPSFYMKENINVPSTAQPARLALSVEVVEPGGVPGDLTGDAAVNVFDLLALLEAWGNCGCCAADLTGDNLVNVFDLLELLANWG